MDNFMKPTGNVPSNVHAGGNPHFDEWYPTGEAPQMPSEMLGHFIDHSGKPKKPPMPIINKRIFAAPRERVFEVFRNPIHLAQWWE
jgi:hypothetical protein